MDGDSWHCTGDRDQDHPQEKEMQKVKWLLEALQIAEKEEKRKAKEKRIYHLNAEIQRLVRDKIW